MSEKRDASPSRVHNSAAKKSRLDVPTLTLSREYEQVHIKDLDVAALNLRYRETGPALNLHVLALAHAARLTPGYMREQLRYILLPFNDIDTTTDSFREHANNSEFKIRSREFCIKAINSYGKIQAHAAHVRIKPDVQYYATKLRCAFMSIMVTTEDLERLE